jgi:signal transduction histidine kinase
VLGPLASLACRLANALLNDERSAATARSAAEMRLLLKRAVTITAVVSTATVVVLFVIWALTGGRFWPVWPLISFALVVGVPGAMLLVLEHPGASRLAGGSAALAMQLSVSIVVLAFLIAVWAVGGDGYFWPMWSALGLVAAAIVHAAVVYIRNHHRIEKLEASRAGAVDVQETELRRIERDLHDGAQARLVALGMSLASPSSTSTPIPKSCAS